MQCMAVKDRSNLKSKIESIIARNKMKAPSTVYLMKKLRARSQIWWFRTPHVTDLNLELAPHDA